MLECVPIAYVLLKQKVLEKIMHLIRHLPLPPDNWVLNLLDKKFVIVLKTTDFKS